MRFTVEQIEKIAHKVGLDVRVCACGCGRKFADYKSGTQRYFSNACVVPRPFTPKERKHRSRSGKRDDLGGLFVRSAWEANYARYLTFLVDNGQIISWNYEPKTFWFDGITRGTRSYLPDFEVVLKNGEVEYHEVKGWMYPKGKTALKRMRKYHPSVKIILIGEKEYRQIDHQLGKVIKHWE